MASGLSWTEHIHPFCLTKVKGAEAAVISGKEAFSPEGTCVIFRCQQDPPPLLNKAPLSQRSAHVREGEGLTGGL